MRQLMLLAAILFAYTAMQAQDAKLSKADKYHQKALQYYNASIFDLALAESAKAIKADKNHIESWLLEGDIFAFKQDMPNAIHCYKQAISINRDFFPPAVYILANLQFESRLYAECIDNYEWYLQYSGARLAEKNKSIANLEKARFRNNAMLHPLNVTPVNLGPGINTAGYEFVNYISADGSTLYFTRRMTTGNERDEQFYYSRRINDTLWSDASELGPPVNTTGDEGALCLSPDGQFLIFSACDRPDGFGSCDLYIARREGKHWSEPLNMGPVINSSYWETQPSFSSDGLTLYFVSNRPGGYGSSDIWISKRVAGGDWGRPINAGEPINTSESERGPFIHPDGQTLYFSSKGHPGMGEGDIFYSKRGAEGIWSEPVNIGYPLNTPADEVTFIVDNEGKFAYFSSASEQGYGKQDIYRVNLPEQIKPMAVTFMKGVVTDSITGKFLGASFQLTDLESGKKIVQSESDPLSGEFLMSVPAGKKYALVVEKKGYLFYSATISPGNSSDIHKPYLKDIKLKPVKTGETFVLNNIFFETDSARLLPASITELNYLYQLLNRNSKICIEIGGHTDNTGKQAYNYALSERRARAVYDFLIDKGINPGRLKCKGYGSDKPIADNATELGRAQNRRTEIKITGN